MKYVRPANIEALVSQSISAAEREGRFRRDPDHLCTKCRQLVKEIHYRNGRQEWCQKCAEEAGIQ